jgi:hypothetical protein
MAGNDNKKPGKLLLLIIRTFHSHLQISFFYNSFCFVHNSEDYSLSFVEVLILKCQLELRQTQQLWYFSLFRFAVMAWAGSRGRSGMTSEVEENMALRFEGEFLTSFLKITEVLAKEGGKEMFWWI